MNWRLVWLGWMANAFLCCGVSPSGQADAGRTIVAVDFGGADRPGPWNVIADPASDAIHDLRTLTGASSGITLQLTDDFADVNRFGCRRTADALGLPVSVSSDSFWGNALPYKGGVNPSGGLLLSGLTPGEWYAIEVYASRVSDQAGRITQYVIAGDTAWLDAANNADQRAHFEVQPDAKGELRLAVSAGPGNVSEQRFFYLGAMVISFRGDRVEELGGRFEDLGGVVLGRPNGERRWQLGAEVEVAWDNMTGDSVSVFLSGAAGDVLLGRASPTADGMHWRVQGPSGPARIRLQAGAASAGPSAPVTLVADSTDIRPIVVIGSSTAAGAGASSPDSAWVGRYRTALAAADTRFPVINLAKGGYTTRHLKPAGEGVDSLRNITMALSLLPAAVILNLPSNDAAQRMPFAETWANFEAMAEAAAAAGVPLWVATTQPRNGLDAGQTQLQSRTRDAILSFFGERALDFWSGLATPDGGVLPECDAGDGVHLTDAGHGLLFERVLAADLPAHTSPRRWPAGWSVTFDDSIRVHSGIQGPVDYRWVDGAGNLLQQGRTQGPHFAFERQPTRLDAIHTLHLSDGAGGGGVWRGWVKAYSAASPGGPENAHR